MKKIILVALLMVSNAYSQNYASNSGDISLKCSKQRGSMYGLEFNKSERNWRELLWIINVDAGYVVKMLDIEMVVGMYFTQISRGNKKIRETPEKYNINPESDLKTLQWYIYQKVEERYYLDRETLNLRVIGLGINDSKEFYSCEIITRQELDEIKLKRLQAKSASLKADRIKKEKEDAEQKKKNKL